MYKLINKITFGVIPNKLITLAANTKAGEINHKSGKKSFVIIRY